MLVVAAVEIVSSNGRVGKATIDIQFGHSTGIDFLLVAPNNRRAGEGVASDFGTNHIGIACATKRHNHESSHIHNAMILTRGDRVRSVIEFEPKAKSAAEIGGRGLNWNGDFCLC